MSETSGKVPSYKLVDKLRTLVNELDKALNVEQKGRPEEAKNELDRLLEEYIADSLLTPKGVSSLKEDLRTWKAKDHIVDANKTILDEPISPTNLPLYEEKPMRLWELLIKECNFDFSSKVGDWQKIAKAVLDWFEGILPKYNSPLPMNDKAEGYWLAITEIRQRIERERNG